MEEFDEGAQMVVAFLLGVLVGSGAVSFAFLLLRLGGGL
jgi:hypothetical protein